jgi:hypothetical protein
MHRLLRGRMIGRSGRYRIVASIVICKCNRPPLSAQQPHIEIAINRRTEPIPLVNAGWIWIRFLICAQQYGISCVLLYQDIIHCCHLGRRQVPGLQAWAYLQSLQLQRPNRARPDSIMKIEELETGDWAKLVESWSEA